MNAWGPSEGWKWDMLFFFLVGGATYLKDFCLKLNKDEVFLLDEFTMILKKRRPSFLFLCNKCDRVLLKLRNGPRSNRKFFFCFYAGDWICLLNIFLWFPTRFSLKQNITPPESVGIFSRKHRHEKKTLRWNLEKKMIPGAFNHSFQSIFSTESFVGTFTCLLAIIHPQRWAWWWRNG